MRRIIPAFLAGLAVATLSMRGGAEAQDRREGYFPNLPVVTHDGRTVRFYDDLIKDKIVIVSFIYTSCTDICPVTTARLAQVEEKLGAVVGRDIFIISLTVDPENDTPDKLKAYAEAFDAGPGWLFVTGKPADIKAINYRLGERSKDLSQHRNEIVLGNDATGEWQRDNVLGDIDRVVMTIRAMDPKWRDQVRVPPRTNAMNTGLHMGDQPGQAMFKKICAPCHTIGVGDRVGPDLRGVTERRERAWLFSYLRDPAAMRKHDPVAIEMAAKFETVRMPNLRLSDVDTADLISYLTQETAKLADAKMPVVPGGHRHKH